MDDGKKAEFIRLVRDTVADSQCKAPDDPVRQAIHLNGHGNTAVINTGGSVHIHQRPKVVVSVKPGSIHISHEQAARLKVLVLAAVRATGETHQAVWTALHQCMVVPQYRLIPAAAFDDAVAQLERWISTRSLKT